MQPARSYDPDPGVRTVFVTRYVTPLREGGSLPAIVEADDLGTYVLTSALKRVDTAVYDAIKDAKSGHFKGGSDATYGLTDNGVGIGKFSPKAPAGIAAKVDAIKQQIVSGKITNIPTTVK